MVMTIERTLGQKIRRARERKGWNQAQLAKELGVSSMAVSGWETDTNVPRLSVRPKVWEVLGLTPDDFDTDPPPNGGRRYTLPVSSQEAKTEGEQVQTLGQLVTTVVNSVEENLPLSMRRDLERSLQDGLRAVESQRPDLVDRVRRDLSNPEYRTSRFLLSVAFAFSSYMANRHSATATADLEATIDELDTNVESAA